MISLKKESNINPEGTISSIRAKYFQLISAQQRDPEQIAALKKELYSLVEIRSDLDITNFDNFTDRHRLRVRLFEAYADSVNPLDIDDPWGYWQPKDLQRQARALLDSIFELQTFFLQTSLA